MLARFLAVVLFGMRMLLRHVLSIVKSDCIDSFIYS